MTEPDIAAAERDAIMEQLREPGSAIAVDWTFARYLAASDFTSRSALEDLRDRGPAYYYAKHVARTVADSRTPAMVFGSHGHMALLEPEEWASRLYPQAPSRPPGANGAAKKKDPEGWALYDGWKADCAEWERGQTSRSIIVSPEDLHAIESIRHSVMVHPTAAKVFQLDGANEQTILWHHPESGVLVRCRLDRVFGYDAKTVLIADIKTTNNPTESAFSRSIAKFGYHRQAAIYIDAIRALYGAEVQVHFDFIAVRTTFPFECAYYSLVECPGLEDGETSKGPIELGREQYTRTLHDLARRRAENDWLSPWQREPVPIDIPPYAYKET